MLINVEEMFSLLSHLHFLKLAKNITRFFPLQPIIIKNVALEQPTCSVCANTDVRHTVCCLRLSPLVP